MKLVSTVISIIAGFIFAMELSRPDPGITGGTILTCLLISFVIMLPVITKEPEDKKNDD